MKGKKKAKVTEKAVKKGKVLGESLCFGPVIVFFLIGLLVGWLVGDLTRWALAGLGIGIVMALIVTVRKMQG